MAAQGSNLNSKPTAIPRQKQGKRTNGKDDYGLNRFAYLQVFENKRVDLLGGTCQTGKCN